MRVIIGGCGRVGARLATKLAGEGHEIAVIDKDPRSFARLGSSWSGDTIRGMVFDRDAMERAGFDRSDAYVAVTSGDNSNIVSATVARDVFRVPKVVARIFDPRRATIYRRLGIQTVSSVSWAANEILSLVMHQQLVRDLTLGDAEVQLLRFGVPPRLARRSVADLAVPGEVLPVAIVRSGSSFIPTSHEELAEGDVVQVAVLTSAMDRFERLIAP